MATPVRYTSGFTQAAPWQPLANMGQPNPFFYNTFQSDFDTYAAADWTVTAATGVAGLIAGDGGIAALTTTAAISDFVSIQKNPAAFAFVPATPTVAGKKTFFLCRLSPAGVNVPAYICGLVSANATPFTAIADGVYFSKAANSNVVTLNSAVGGVTTSVTVPAAAISASANGFVTLGFEVTQSGDIRVFANPNADGFIPQSGTGATLPNRGPVAVITAPTLTAVNLAPILSVQTPTATIQQIQVDYVMAARER